MGRLNKNWAYELDLAVTVCCYVCDVSPPFNIYWNISSSGTSDRDVANMSTVTEESRCYYDIQHQLQQPGNYLLAVLVDNGVSQAHVHYNLRVDLPKSGKLSNTAYLKSHPKDSPCGTWPNLELLKVKQKNKRSVWQAMNSNNAVTVLWLNHCSLCKLATDAFHNWVSVSNRSRKIDRIAILFF